MKDMQYSDEELVRLLNTLDDDVSVPLDVQTAWRKAVRREAQKQKTVRKWVRIASSAAALVLVGGLTFYAFGNDKKDVNRQEVQEMPALILGTTYLESDGEEEESWTVTQDTDECAVSGKLAEGKLEITSPNAEESLTSLRNVISDNGGYFTEEENNGSTAVFKGTFVIPNNKLQNFFAEMERCGFSQPVMEYRDITQQNVLLESQQAALKMEAENDDSYELQENIASIEKEMLELDEKTRYALITVEIKAE